MFKEVNFNINKNYLSPNHIYAIDGSKIKVHNCFKNYGYNTRTCDKIIKKPAKKPLAMLSSLIGINTDTVVNYTITKSFNEREFISPLIDNLDRKDTVILDRGYFSKDIFSLFHEKKVNCIIRIKKDANKIVKAFYYSHKKNLSTFLINNDTIIPIRYVKYTLDKHKYILCTSVKDKSINQLKAMYKLRWRAELSFKRLKSYLNINKIYSLNEQFWLQEMQLRILLDTLTRSIQLNIKTKNKYVFTFKYILNIFCNTITIHYNLNRLKHLNNIAYYDVKLTWLDK